MVVNAVVKLDVIANMKTRLLIIIGILVIGIAMILYDYQMKQVRPFEGDPQNNVSVLRQTFEINEFYKMYEKYDVEIADMTEEQVRFVFVASDDENRTVNLDVRYYDGKPDAISHHCHEMEPRSKIFSEELVITNCFES